MVEPIRLFLSGDVMTGRGIDQVLPHPVEPTLHEGYVRDARQYVQIAELASGPIPRSVDFSYVWGDALEELERESPDVRVINLETAVTTSDDAWPAKGVHYRMHPDNAPVVTAAGIDCCSLANNHVLDWGQAGLRETLDVLQPIVRTAGAGRNSEEAARPAILELDGDRRVLVFAFGSPSSGIPESWGATPRRPGVRLVSELSGLSAREISAEVARHRRPGDVVVVSIHWGSNWGYGVPSDERAFAHRLIELRGADLVHGHSSHHVKAFEVHQGKLILYGCGDFINDYEGIEGYEAFRDDLTLMYFPRIDPVTGELCELRLTPMRTIRFRASHVSENDRTWLLDTLTRECARFGVTVAPTSDGALQASWR